MKTKPRLEIFQEAKVQCQYCGRFFIKKVHHNCNTGFRKHKHKWIEL